MSLRHWSQIRLAVLWWATLPVIMLFLPLGILARRNSLRLPAAAGRPEGIEGRGAAFGRLLVVGESPVSGVGVDDYQQSIGACVARKLSSRWEATIHWQAMGWNGIQIAELVSRLRAEDLPAADLVLVVLGVNDTTGLTRRSTWRAELQRLVRLLARRTGGQVVLASVPPLQDFTAIPQPLRWWLGLRACLLDRDIAKGAAGASHLHASVKVPVQPQMLASDGFHPSALGCQVWAGQLVDQLPCISPGPATP